MSPQELAYPSLGARIDCWQKEVARQTGLYFHTQHSSHDKMKLRPSSSPTINKSQSPAPSPSRRLVLGPTSANSQDPRKRKAVSPELSTSHITADRTNTMSEGQSPKKPSGASYKITAGVDPFGSKRGRPLGSKNKPKSQESDLLDGMAQMMAKTPNLAHSVPASQGLSYAQRTDTSSPSKQRGKQLDKPPAQDNLLITMLASCDPAVYLRTMQALRKGGQTVPESVRKLYELMMDIPSGSTIPEDLKVRPILFIFEQ